MNKKCNKYEAYFMFADEYSFNEHLKECSYCRGEYEKEQKLSKLIKDSYPEYLALKQKKRVKNILYKTACIFFICLTLGVYSGFKINQNSKYQQFLKANTEVSVITQYGLPVDECGFFDYN
ncbi:hypothetical protein IJG14_00100 [bacterium]|nr:hypothetical protein [bacterium]